MSSLGMWRFSNRLYDVVITRVNGWKFFGEVIHERGKLPCKLYSWDVAPEADQECGGRKLQPGDRIKAKIHLHWSERDGGFELRASEREAQIQSLSNRVDKGTVVVEARVCEKMSGSFGVKIVTEQFRGLSGVVHRINMPGENVGEQFRCAADAQIGDIVRCRVERMNEGYLPQWQTVLSLRDVPTDWVDTYVEPPAEWCTCPNCELDNGFVMPMKVEKRLSDDKVQLEFETNGHLGMVCHLQTKHMWGPNPELKQRRMSRLKAGDIMPLMASLHRRGDSVELRATEPMPFHLLDDMEEVMDTGAPVIVNARVVRKWKKTMWVELTSGKFEQLRGLVRIDQTKSKLGKRERALARSIAVGELIAARVADLHWGFKTRFPVRLSLSLLTEEDASRTWSVA